MEEGPSAKTADIGVAADGDLTARVVPFTQLHLVDAPGIPTGVYPVGPATGRPSAVLSLRTSRAAVARPRRRQRMPSDEDTPPAATTWTVTHADLAAGVEGFDAARQFVARCRRDEDTREHFVQGSITIVNRAIRVSRLTQRDPYLIELTRADPYLVRIGWGPLQDVLDGRWREVIEVPPIKRGRVSRSERIAPTATVAECLARRAPAIEANELLLRAILAYEQERFRAAAVALHAGVVLAIIELNGLDDPRSGDAAKAAEDRLPHAERLATAARNSALSKEDLPLIAEVASAVLDEVTPLYTRRYG
jgi:hypothetical protein